MRKTSKIITGLALAGVTVAGGAAFTASGTDNSFTASGTDNSPAQSIAGSATVPSWRATEPPQIFRQANAAISQLMDANVEWQSPPSLTVGDTADIGLAIGGGDRLQEEIAGNLPDTLPIPAGQIPVGPDVKATLIVDPNDATVEPNDPIDASTTSNVALLWTWKLHPVHPSDALSITAHVEVLAGTDHVVTHDVPLRLRVDGTLQFYAYQFFMSWGEWAALVAILGAVISGGRWALRRFGRSSDIAGPNGVPHEAPTNVNVGGPDPTNSVSTEV